MGLQFMDYLSEVEQNIRIIISDVVKNKLIKAGLEEVIDSIFNEWEKLEENEETSIFRECVEKTIRSIIDDYVRNNIEGYIRLKLADKLLPIMTEILDNDEGLQKTLQKDINEVAESLDKSSKETGTNLND